GRGRGGELGGLGWGQRKLRPSSRRYAIVARVANSTIQPSRTITNFASSGVPAAVATNTSRTARVGVNELIASSQPGKISGGMNIPPANASGNSVSWTTATAALGDIAYPIARPSSVNGVAIPITVTSTGRIRAGSSSALVPSHPTTTSGTSAM